MSILNSIPDRNALFTGSSQVLWVKKYFNVLSYGWTSLKFCEQDIFFLQLWIPKIDYLNNVKMTVDIFNLFSQVHKRQRTFLDFQE